MLHGCFVEKTYVKYAFFFLSALCAFAQDPSLISEYFLGGDKVGNKHSHASTMAENDQGLFMTWFGGTSIGNRDVKIYFSQYKDASWTQPQIIVQQDEIEDDKVALYNPVIFASGPKQLTVYYKIGTSPSKWEGRYIISDDAGKTWSKRTIIPKGFLGPTKNKPLRLKNGTVLMPSSDESKKWQISVETQTKSGEWKKTLLPLPGKNLIQPSLLYFADNAIEMLCRSKAAQKGAENYIHEAWSFDQGKTWTTPKPTKLKNPNSGIDAIAIDGQVGFLVHNDSFSSRSILRLKRTQDRGKTWEAVKTLVDEKEGEYSYPSIMQDRSGKLHISFSWLRRKIKHIVIDLQKL